MFHRIVPGAALCLCAVLLPVTATQAAEPLLWGYGVRSCADYLSACEADESGDGLEYQRYEDWLTGLVSGLNLATGEDMLRGSGIDSAMRRTRAHCKGHPKDDFFNAAMDFVRTLSSLK
jgi:hypothetical protein